MPWGKRVQLYWDEQEKELARDVELLLYKAYNTALDSEVALLEAEKHGNEELALAAGFAMYQAATMLLALSTERRIDHSQVLYMRALKQYGKKYTV